MLYDQLFRAAIGMKLNRSHSGIWHGYSKLLFDQVVRRMLDMRATQIVGLRYFNVYGPNEEHKAKYSMNMASVAWLMPEKKLKHPKIPK